MGRLGLGVGPLRARDRASDRRRRPRRPAADAHGRRVRRAAAGQVTLTTPYPAVAVAPGTKVSFDLSVETDIPGRVDLTLERRADGLDGRIRSAAASSSTASSPTGSKATDVRLDVTVPGRRRRRQRSGSTSSPTAGGAIDTLPLDIRVTPNAAGEVSLTTDFPELKGAVDHDASRST